MCEAGLFPGLNYYLSELYTRDEYAKRVCMLSVATAFSGAFGGLIAYGVLQMDGISGVAGWRWLYYIEGLASTVIGTCGFFWLPSTAEEAHFLNSEEKEMARLRRIRRTEDADNGRIQWCEVLEAFASPVCWMSGLVQFSSDICLYGECRVLTVKEIADLFLTGFSTFLPSIIQGMGFRSLKVQVTILYTSGQQVLLSCHRLFVGLIARDFLGTVHNYSSLRLGCLTIHYRRPVHGPDSPSQPIYVYDYLWPLYGRWIFSADCE